MHSYNKIKSRIKSVYYVILALAILFISQACAQIISNICLELFSTNPIIDDLIYSVVYIGTTLALGLTCIKYVFHFSLEDIGIKKSLPGIKWILIGIFLPAFLFSILHLSDIREQAIGDTFLLITGGTSVGIMFALIRYRSGSIWASAAVDALWNIIMIGGIVQIYSVDSGTSINAFCFLIVSIIG